MGKGLFRAHLYSLQPLTCLVSLDGHAVALPILQDCNLLTLIRAHSLKEGDCICCRNGLQPRHTLMLLSQRN